MNERDDAAYLQISIINFDRGISWNERMLFRGAIIREGDDSNVLFHNHFGDSGFRYSYPLIQYKSINGNAAIVGINEGAKALLDMSEKKRYNLRLGLRPTSLKIHSVLSYRLMLGTETHTNNYFLMDWLPLNEVNYRKYRSLHAMEEKIFFLENILVGNILSFSKGVNVFYNDKVTVKILNLNNSYQVEYKKVDLIALDVQFETNVSLPSFIGLGKNASMGSGTIIKL